MKINTIGKSEILYIEDNFESYKLVKLFLKDSFIVIHAKTILDAYRLLDEHFFVLILMDISIGCKFDGIELSENIRSNKKFTQIPIISVTAHALKAEKDKILESAIDDYIAKPIKKEQLLKIINHYITN